MLSQKYIDKARNELREDDTRKEQALLHFREWIAKHPFIKNIRQDDVFLLQFLRTRKYVMDKAFSNLEGYVLSQKKYSKWFDLKEADFEKMQKLYKTGYIYPLTERDEQGTKIVFIQLRRIDPEQFSSADAIRLSSVISAALLEEEETQIAGFTTIIDHEGATMKQISLFSVNDIVDLIQCCVNAVGRYKKVCLVNLPSFASFLFEVARSTMNEKMKQRIIHAKDMEDLKKHIDPEILPKEHGGLLSEAEHMENFDVFFKLVHPKLDEIKKDLVVDWKNVTDSNTKTKETIGSFRKLEID